MDKLFTQENTDIQEDVDIDILEDIENQNTLVIHNDDVNTFDWVIESLMDVCSHTQEQAEQVSVIVHFKGKACAKEGAFKKLRPMKNSLIERGISATIEERADH